MKKILSIFLWLFVVIYGLFLWNTILAENEIGIDLWKECLTKMGENCFQYEKIIWIDDEQPRYSAESVVQDSIFAAAYIVWSVLTLVMIVCWLWYIRASKAWEDVSKYKKWLKNAVIWSILVRWAYAIVRLIQYVAQLGD